MRRLLASDLDGTLIFENKISDKNKEGIKRLKEGEALFAISTGRPLNGISRVIKELNIDPDYYILNNGSVILDSKKEVIFKKHINFEIVKKIVENHMSETVVFAVETGFITYIYGTEDAKKNSVFAKEVPTDFEDLVYINDLYEIEEEHRQGVTLLALSYVDGDPTEIEITKEQINEKYGNAIVAYRNTTFIDIVPEGCSKGQGVKTIGDLAQIEMKDIYTIGDSWNDDSMFEITENSFTFPYAEKELQKKTRYIVEDVAQCIHEYILK